MDNMKVRLEKEDKKYITIAQAPLAREIIANMKEDESKPEEYAEMAIKAAYGNTLVFNVEVLKATAKIVKNARAWNLYNDHSEDLDIWVESTAYVSLSDSYECIIIGAYLSDIWQITEDNKKEIASYMYIRRFKEMD